MVSEGIVLENGPSEIAKICPDAQGMGELAVRGSEVSTVCIPDTPYWVLYQYPLPENSLVLDRIFVIL